MPGLVPGNLAVNNVHLGSAKGVMVNALSLATRFHSELTADKTPEHTGGSSGVLPPDNLIYFMNAQISFS